MRRIIMLILVLILIGSGVSSNTTHESRCQQIKLQPGLFGEELISKLKQAGCWCR